ncbi:MAG: aminotransferase class V-fold PLP-dependent enzyme [Clostridia bacterium]|nr:aminotransferase class V-fold PLP-dependent enzyme [Clostridia bacterium]
MNKIYFDNAATSFPKAPGLGEYICDYINNSSVNINRGVYSKAISSEVFVFETRNLIADFFDCDKSIDYSRRVVFTPGVTYSINFFLRGYLKKGDNVIISSLEHHAVLRTVEDLKKEGIEYRIAQCDTHGDISPETFENLIDQNTKAIMVTHASNVCGTILPINEIGQICKKHNIILAVDTAQTAGSEMLSMSKNNIDFLAFSGHKGLLGIQGIGGFIISPKLDRMINPIITGGTGSLSANYDLPSFLPDRFESGTLNLPGIAGLNYSINYIKDFGLDNIKKFENELTKYFINEINSLSDVQIIGHNNVDNRTSVVSLNFLGRDNSEIAYLLDNEYNIMTRVGLHCAPIAHQSLGTLNTGTVRFSFGPFNKISEIEYCICSLKKFS